MRRSNLFNAGCVNRCSTSAPTPFCFLIASTATFFNRLVIFKYPVCGRLVFLTKLVLFVCWLCVGYTPQQVKPYSHAGYRLVVGVVGVVGGVQSNQLKIIDFRISIKIQATPPQQHQHIIIITL
jgi:hypothetical protein